jgi:hypothetical protein
MKKRMRAVVTAAVMLSSVAVAAWAQRAAGPRVVRRVRPEAVRDARLEAAIYRELYAGGVVTGLPERYLYNRVDLDGDGRPEVLAYVHGTSSCGSAGCLLLVYRRAGGGYELVSRINGVENPVFVSERRSNGWRELIAPVRWGEVGGRTVRNYHAVLAFDGGSYPEQFPGARPLGASERARGVAYFAGVLTGRSGFALRAPREP